jgi:S-adenosylmethionine hydrolase
MIVLYTDFGNRDPYLGQMKAVLARQAPGTPVIDLLHDVPRHDIRAGAYLLPAYIDEFPENAVFICVIDPGVGGARRPLIVRAFNRWFVGPDNGLFRILAVRDPGHEVFVIDWRPDRLSDTFHGRDLFAPVGAMLAHGKIPAAHPGELNLMADLVWPEDLFQVIYMDRFGNAFSGARAASVSNDAILEINGHQLNFARTFSAVPAGQSFWYENANGLIEIAVNQGSAQSQLGIGLGDKIAITV